MPQLFNVLTTRGTRMYPDDLFALIGIYHQWGLSLGLGGLAFRFQFN